MTKKIGVGGGGGGVVVWNQSVMKRGEMQNKIFSIFGPIAILYYCSERV